MLTTFNPWLRRSNVVVNRFNSCVSNTSKKFSRTPKMPFSEIFSQPGMLFQKPKSRSSLKQLKSPANAHCRWQLNKQVKMVDSNMEFVDFTPIFNCNLSDKPLTINSDSIKLKRVFGIFRFPDKMEGILPKAVAKTFQIHFSSPEDSSNYLQNLFQEGNINPLSIEQLNINKEDGNSSLCLKAEVSLPWM
jgi:hypothetical protein